MEPVVDTPDLESAKKKPLVIGCFPAPLAFGDKFHIADVRFFDGDLFRPLCNALVYTGNELSIGGRKFIREKGKEIWIVQFGTEKFEFDRLVQSDAPVVASNVRVEARASPRSGAE